MFDFLADSILIYLLLAQKLRNHDAKLQVLHEETNGEALITTGVGQHQMWAAQWYKLKQPRQWATSGGLGSMGFGLPSALGAAAAYDGTDKGRPKKVNHSSFPCQDLLSSQSKLEAHSLDFVGASYYAIPEVN